MTPFLHKKVDWLPQEQQKYNFICCVDIPSDCVIKTKFIKINGNR